jgi:hypothetical protein
MPTNSTVTRESRAMSCLLDMPTLCRHAPFCGGPAVLVTRRWTGNADFPVHYHNGNFSFSFMAMVRNAYCKDFTATLS